MEALHSVIVVDDDGAVLRSLGRLLRLQGYDIHLYEDSREALAALIQLKPLAVVADLHMPGLNGAELLMLARQCCPETFRVLCTGERDVVALVSAMAPMVADALVTKQDCDTQLVRALAEFREREGRTSRHTEALTVALGMVRSLAMRQIETIEHSMRLSRWAKCLAEEFGLPHPQVCEAELGGLLHDVGLVGVRDAVLFKPDKLTPEEWAEMRRHPDLGATMLRDIPLLASATSVVRHHHERWDGTGYPSQFRESSIPIAARVFAVVDAYEAITSARPWRAQASDADARVEISRSSGTHFDPEVVKAFLGIAPEVWMNLRG